MGWEGGEGGGAGFLKQQIIYCDAKASSCKQITKHFHSILIQSRAIRFINRLTVHQQPASQYLRKHTHCSGKTARKRYKNELPFHDSAVYTNRSVAVVPPLDHRVTAATHNPPVPPSTPHSPPPPPPLFPPPTLS